MRHHSLLFAIRYSLFAVIIALCLCGCRSTRGVADADTYLSSRVKLTLPYGGGTMTVSGTMKMISGERLQVSLLMPIVRTEVVRIDLTPDTLTLIERMDKHYLQADRRELRPYLPRRADFAHLEKALRRAAKSDGEVTLNLSDLGLPSLNGFALTLSHFDYRPVELSPTRISNKYRRVEPAELAALLAKLVAQ